VRRALLPDLPLFSRFFGIHPPDIDRMTLREISEYQSVLTQIYSKGGDPWQVAVE
jgi:hypothetical protein